jgi:hypothetical protein
MYVDDARALFRQRLPKSDARKIFCLSLFKTATTSFQEYLRAGGISVAGAGSLRRLSPASANDEHIDRFVTACIKSLNEADGFQDFPWGFFADVWREKYPNARYVVFTRPFDEWFRSYRFHLHGRELANVMVTEFLGVSKADADESEYRTAYEAHYRRAFEATADAPRLVLPLQENDSSEICQSLNKFLGLAVPKFPHKINHRKQVLNQVRHALSQSDVTGATVIVEKYAMLHGKDEHFAEANRLVRAATIQSEL